MKRILSLVVIAVMAVLIPYGAWQAYQNYIISPKPLSQEEIQAKKQKELEEAISKAEAGDAEAQYQLALKYDFGRSNLTVNHQKAAQWYQKAAEQGHVKAQYNLGYLFQEGEGVQKDIHKAMYWFEKAAEQGFVDAYYNLGRFYYFDEFGLSNKAQAYGLFEKAAKGGYVDANYMAGFMLVRGVGIEKNLEEGLEKLKFAADHGSAASLYELAQFYENGDGVKRDYVRAGVLYRQAADKNIHQAEKYLYELDEYCLEHGLEGPEFLYSCQIAASAERLNSRSVLAFLYSLGRYVDQNFVKARELAMPAALEGNPIAQMVFTNVRVYPVDMDEEASSFSYGDKEFQSKQRNLFQSYLWAKVLEKNESINDMPEVWGELAEIQKGIIFEELREVMSLKSEAPHFEKINLCAELFYTDINKFKECMVFD